MLMAAIHHFFPWQNKYWTRWSSWKFSHLADRDQIHNIFLLPVYFLNYTHLKGEKPTNQPETTKQHPPPKPKSTILEIHTYNILQSFQIREEMATVGRDHTELKTSSHLTKHRIPGPQPTSTSNKQKYLLIFWDSFGENKQLKYFRFL